MFIFLLTIATHCTTHEQLGVLTFIVIKYLMWKHVLRAVSSPSFCKMNTTGRQKL